VSSVIVATLRFASMSTGVETVAARAERSTAA
jgi:hypothetical protein